jgi:hypothetical protein
MKSKNFILISLSILSLVFLLNFASADLAFTTIPANATINYGVNWAGVQFGATDAVSYSIDDTTNFIIGSTGFLDNKITLSVGTYVVNVVITDELNNTLSTPYKLQVLALKEAETCKYSDNGNLDLSIEDISVDKGYGKDSEWFPLDDIIVEVEVENNGNEKISSIIVSWGLYNKDTQKWIIKDKESSFNLKDGDDKTINLEFTLEDVKDFKNEGDYVFYVWATGKDTEYDENTCVLDSESIEIIIESDFVIIGDLETLQTASCGSEIFISGRVWNVGDDDQDEVKVLISNSELGLSKLIEIGDIDAFDNELLEYTFQLPKNLEEKTYTIKLTVYDEDNDVYQNDYEDDKSVKDIFLKVEGGCSVAEASVNAVLESGGQAGKPLIVKATIKNTGTSSANYVLNVGDYGSWASSVSLDKTSLTLDAGESEDVLITLNVNNDAVGDKLFSLDVLSEDELVVSQPVQIEITKKKGFLGITGNVISGDNKYLWGIGLINLILIVLIIVIAIRIARK